MGLGEICLISLLVALLLYLIIFYIYFREMPFHLIVACILMFVGGALIYIGSKYTDTTTTNVINTVGTTLVIQRIIK